jgi:fucose 4-O-acetylase-like acetyltransferase
MELLALYVVFDILYAGFYYYLFNEIPGRPVLFAPHWIMWFLLSLVLWQITLPWVLKIRHNLMWMLVIGIMIGYLPASGNVLAVSKTLVFYPFFLVGYYLQSYGFKIPHQAQFTYLSVSIFVALGAMLYYYVDPIMMKQLFHGNYSYADLGISGLSAGFCRIIAYLMSGICCLCFFCMISAKKVIFTSAGKYSLHIYLAHGFPVIVLRYTHLLATS